MFRGLLIIMMSLACFVLFSVETSTAQVKVEPGSLNRTKVKVGGRSRTVNIYCRGLTGGELTARRVKGKRIHYFSSFAQIIKGFRRQRPSQSRNDLVRALAKAAPAACRKAMIPPTPDELSLAPYAGSFGREEARILLDRFAFGGSPELLAQAPGMGIGRFVDSLTTLVPEKQWVENIVADYRCDGYPSGDSRNRPCEPGNPNDVSMSGVRYGTYARMWYSANPFFEKLFLFLHDERMAVSHDALGWNERHAIGRHLDMLRRASRSGNYKQFMKEWNDDFLGHLRWLDGGINRGDNPNENYAREFWELGTVGPTDRNGRPVYSDADVFQAALAFSGWSIRQFEQNGFYVNYGAFVPALHAPGPKVIFAGTPHQATVYDADDMLEATFRHPRTAEHLAEDIWKEFINPYANTAAIQALAQVIRDNNYNLIPVFRTIMRSKAMFAAKSRKSLVKHPADLVFGFLRQTKIPTDYWTIDDVLRRLGQQPLNAPTVFGWDERQLAGEAYVLEWRNAVLRFTSRSNSDWLEQGFDCSQRFFSGIPTSLQASTALSQRFGDMLGVPLTQKQLQHLVQYLDYDYQICSNPSYCDGKNFRITRRVFDPNPESDESKGGCYKARGVLTILAALPEYRMK